MRLPSSPAGAALLTTALALGGLLAGTPPTLADHGACGSDHAMESSVVTGSVNAKNHPSDHWQHTATATKRTFSVSATPENVGLTLFAADCATTLCRDLGNDATNTCTTSVGGTVHVELAYPTWSDADPSSVKYTLTLNETTFQCGDGIDNDADGLVDHGLDPQCASAADASEAPDPECSDGVDNDSDGKTDWGSDWGCSSASDNTESPNPQCSDGADNDGDGKVDYPADTGCTSNTDNVEAPDPQCSDGVDNDGDGKTDYPGDQGCTSRLDTQEGATCAPTLGVVACLTPNTEVRRLSLGDPNRAAGETHTVAGYVEMYTFTTVHNAKVTLPCVRLVADGVGSNPCARLGGTYVSQLHALLDTVSEPDVTSDDPLVEVRVCSAELTITYLGEGIDSAAAYALC